MTGRPDRKRANLRDVARAAGVSVATASRVLNSPDVVTPATRKRVQQAMTDLRFVRNAAARAINTGRTRVVGALVPTLDNAIFARFLNSLEVGLDEFGLSLVVATTGNDTDREAQKARELLDIGVEGLILTGLRHASDVVDAIAHRQLPAIAISCFDPQGQFPTIGYDNTVAAAAALTHLTDLGHKRIAVIHGPCRNNDRTQARLAGLDQANADARMALWETELSVEGGSSAAAQILEDRHPFDAWLCLSDVLALGALFQLQRRGISVPREVSLIGMDDLPSSRLTAPALTTVRLPSQDMGQMAASALGNWVENDSPASAIELPTGLVLRESTGPAR